MILGVTRRASGITATQQRAPNSGHSRIDRIGELTPEQPDLLDVRLMKGNVDPVDHDADQIFRKSAESSQAVARSSQRYNWPVVFMLVSKYGFADVLGAHSAFDPSRVAAQIVSGIGFIGGGLIFVRRDAVRHPRHRGRADRGRAGGRGTFSRSTERQPTATRSPA